MLVDQRRARDYLRVISLERKLMFWRRNYGRGTFLGSDNRLAGRKCLTQG